MKRRRTLLESAESGLGVRGGQQEEAQECEVLSRKWHRKV